MVNPDFRGPKLQMKEAVESRRWNSAICPFLLSLVCVLALGRSVRPQAGRAPMGTADPSSPAKAASALPPAIVIGFVGGVIRHDDLVHSEVQLAARLRKESSSGVEVETYENYRWENARKKILSLLDTNHSGTLTPDEKHNARIILYGHSWGGSAAITLARELGKDGIPVLLTIQVDSVAKFSQNDSLVPANVAQAANYYQPDGLIHGQTAIRAADPSRTKIVGNFRFDYKGVAYACGAYPWYDRMFMKPHTQIECDPKVWDQVEALIRSALSQSQAPAGQSK
jgi:hypothetical protein